MKQLLAIVLTLLLASACTARIAPFSPRRGNTADHRQALTSKACRDCHDPAELPGHKAKDDCLRCHHLNVGEPPR